MTEPLLRSLEFERGVTEQACKGIVNAAPIIDHAEIRARNLSREYVSDFMWIATGRDRRHDVREELADARNHLIWDMQQNIEDEQRAWQSMRALRHIALAYDLLLRD